MGTALDDTEYKKAIHLYKHRNTQHRLQLDCC